MIRLVCMGWPQYIFIRSFSITVSIGCEKCGGTRPYFSHILWWSLLATESWRVIYNIDNHFVQLVNTCSMVSLALPHPRQQVLPRFVHVGWTLVMRQPSCVTITFLTAIEDHHPRLSQAKDVTTSELGSVRFGLELFKFPSVSIRFFKLKTNFI